MASIVHESEKNIMSTRSASRLGWFLLASLLVLIGTRYAAAQENKGVAIKVSKNHVDFLAKGELATRYHIGPEFSKPIFWPVRAPNGASLTRSWPLANGIPGESTDHV